MNYIKLAREKDIERLATLTKDEQKARKIMNSFYRLSALEQRLMELENDADFYSRARSYLAKEDARADEWRKRLNTMLEGTGLSVFVSGGYPKIVKYGEHHGIDEVFTYGHYYR